MGQHTLEGAIEIFQTLADDHDMTPNESEAWAVIRETLADQRSTIQAERDLSHQRFKEIDRLRSHILSVISGHWSVTELQEAIGEL